MLELNSRGFILFFDLLPDKTVVQTLRYKPHFKSIIQCNGMDKTAYLRALINATMQSKTLLNTWVPYFREAA
jgi:hypothetical protein